MSVLLSIEQCAFVFADNPSSWAVNDIQAAKENYIINSDFEKNYKKTITREEFCNLVILTIKQWYNINKDIPYIDDISNIYTIPEEEVSFLDTNDENIINCAKLGIVSGMGNGKFEPNNPITREQAAKMLFNTLDVATPVIDNYKNNTKNGVNGIFLPHLFEDGRYISNWARNEIYAMYHLGIMLGTDSDNFSPKDNYTVEQAICTFLRLYNSYTAPEKVTKPEFELYPDIYTGNLLNKSSSDTTYYLNAPYLWYDENFKYEPTYYDGFGNVYTAKEKGYVYPLNKQSMVVNVAAGVGVSSNIVIDKNGNQILEPFYGLLELNGEKAAVMELGGVGCSLYNMETGEKINQNYDFIQYIGCGIYAFDKDGKRGYMNSDFEEVMPDIYNLTEQTFFNDLCVFQKQDKSFIIVNTKGKTLKSFKLDLNKYELNGIFGTNMLLIDKKTGSSVLYRAYSGKYVTDYPMLWFTKTGDILAQKGGKKYILDKEGKLKVDLDSKGYDDIQEYFSSEFYVVCKIDKSNWGRILPADIMDYNGNIIRKGVTSFEIKNDISGLYAYKSGVSQITVFDSYGKDIGIVNVKGSIEDFKFLNGLIFVNSTENDNRYTVYYTPTGEEAVTNSYKEN